MIRLVFIGIWGCLVTLGSAYGAMLWQKSRLATASTDAHAGFEMRKTRLLSVPMIADGKVTGYVVAQFSYTVDPRVVQRIGLPPDIYLLDEAFKSLYGDPDLDFRHLEKYDVAALTRKLALRVNARLNAKAVGDVLLQEFNYVGKSDVQR
jgi:hypothetical protein